jgi:tetratricopeptide (TPR) repeat protein
MFRDAGGDEEILVQTYMSRVAALQSKPKFTAEDIEAMTRELGFTEEDLQTLETYYHEHLTRGKGFAKYGRWSEAITQLQKATAIKPFAAEAFFELGVAYKKRWQHEAEPRDKAAAEKALARCLEIMPEHEEAFKQLGELGRYAVSVETVGSIGSGKMRWETITGIVIAFIIFVGLIALGIWAWS